MKIDGFCYITNNLEEFYITDIFNIPNTNTQVFEEAKILNDLEGANCLFVYDRKTKKFYIDYEEISIDGLNLIPRCSEKYLLELIEAINNNGGISLETKLNYLRSKVWFKHIQPKYREIICKKYMDFMYLYEDDKDMFGNEILLKHIETGKIYEIKSYGKNKKRQKPFIYKERLIEDYFHTIPNTSFIPGDDLVAISKNFSPIGSYEYDLEKIEYSIYVINGEIFSVGLTDLKNEIIISEEMEYIIKDWVDKINSTNKFGKNYTFKLAEMFIDGTRVIDLIDIGSIADTKIEQSHNLINNLKKFNGQYTKRLTLNNKKHI